jgi:hypothetical protein
MEPQECRLAPEGEKLLLASRWPELESLLGEDVKVRATERVASLERELARRRDTETKNTQAVFSQLRLTLEGALGAPAPVQLTFDDLDREERQQLDRDRDAWQARLDGLDNELDRELAAIANRYAGVRELVFPFALAVCVPDERPGSW